MKKEMIEWTICIMIAIILGISVKYFIGTPTIVKSISMEPTLIENQRLILNRFWFRVAKQMPRRGEIITIEAPSKEEDFTKSELKTGVAQYNQINHGFANFVYHILEIGKKSYIKRVIGLPGEHVEIKNGKVYINEEELEEKYLSDKVITDSNGGSFINVIVPENCVFVMGDNRSHSNDSRRFGCIPLEHMESVVYIRFWPFDLWGKVE